MLLKRKMLALMWQPPHSVPLKQWKKLLLDVSEELSSARSKEGTVLPDGREVDITHMLYFHYLSIIHIILCLFLFYLLSFFHGVLWFLIRQSH